MKPSWGKIRIGAIGRFHAAGLIMVVAILLSVALSSRATCGDRATVDPEREAWRAWGPDCKAGKGSFKATYPNTEWQEVPCTTPPQRPYPPRHRRRPDIVGNTTDNAAKVSGFISSAVGSFDSVTGVTSESGKVGGKLPLVANTFSLQVNTNLFSTSTCNGVAGGGVARAGSSSCSQTRGGGYVFMQYWLLNYGTKVPWGSGVDPVVGTIAIKTARAPGSPRPDNRGPGPAKPDRRCRLGRDGFGQFCRGEWLFVLGAG